MSGTSSRSLEIEVVALSRKVNSGALAPGEALRELLSRHPMNENSARDYLSSARAILDGKVYKRALNVSSVEAILLEIAAEGHESALRSLKAVRKHIDYRRSGSGLNQPGLAALCERLEAKFAEVDLAGVDDFFKQVQASLRRDPAERRKLLPESGHKPTTSVAMVTIYNRNPHVVAEVLLRASGNCEACGAPAPFKRKSSDSPYLEVHHRVTLANGGDDTVENAVALCPNCHRKQHHG